MTTANFSEQFDRLYKQHHQWLYQWLTKYLHSQQHIDDILQETFYKILLRPELLNEIKDPKPFLAKTAKNIIIDRTRKAQVEQKYICTLDHEHHEGCKTTPVEHIISMELAHQITTAISTLDDRPKQVVIMHYVQGVSQVNIAKKLSLSTKTIQTDLIKAISHCQYHIKKT